MKVSEMHNTIYRCIAGDIRGAVPEHLPGDGLRVRHHLAAAVQPDGLGAGAGLRRSYPRQRRGLHPLLGPHHRHRLLHQHHHLHRTLRRLLRPHRPRLPRQPGQPQREGQDCSHRDRTCRLQRRLLHLSRFCAPSRIQVSCLHSVFQGRQFR